MPDLKNDFSSVELSPDPVYQRCGWWGAIDMEIFKNLNEVAQRQLVTMSLQTQAEGLEKMAGALGQR